jgi:hypothetical protein
MMKARKRDGRLDPFDPSKIACAIGKAARSAGYDDPLLGEELSSVVTLFLERDYAEGVVPIEEIQEMVERVLMETGHTYIARAFLLHRERRRQLKEIIEVRDSEGETRDIEVDGPEKSTVSPWSKGRIIAALVKEAEIPAGMAAEIAAEVEAKVFRTGLTRIASSLIRELVDNELFNRGLSRRLQNQSLLGIPGYDLRRLVESDSAGRTPAQVAEQVSGTVLRQYAMRWIHSPEEVDAHLKGDMTIEGLQMPSGYLSVELEPTQLPAPFGGPPRSARYIAACTRFLERFAAQTVRIDITDAGLLAHTASGLAPADFAEDLLTALSLGPVNARALTGKPVIRLERRITERRAAWLKAAHLRGEDARAFMDALLVAFLDQAVKLGRELSLPVLQVDLASAREPGEDLMNRLVVLEAAGRLELSIAREEEPLAAVTPVLGGVQLGCKTLFKKAGDLKAEVMAAELQSALAMATSAMFSKNQYMKKLHRKGRGPKAAIRRFLGGNGETVGNGYFRLVPTALLHLLEAGLARRFEEAAAMEGRKSGHRIRIKAPWFNGQESTGNASLHQAARETLAWSDLVSLDPVPSCFKGEAEERIAYLRMIIEGLSERNNVS